MSDFDGNPCLANPCPECPWRYNSAPGYLGPHSAQEWVEMAHGETPIACHMTIEVSESWEGCKQCAGAAAYRANVAKTPRDPRVAKGPRREDVFDTPDEFIAHHDPKVPMYCRCGEQLRTSLERRARWCGGCYLPQLEDGGD